MHYCVCYAVDTPEAKYFRRYVRWFNEELAFSSASIKMFNAVQGFKALTIHGNIGYFMNPLVFNAGYDRPRYAQAYVMDGDIAAETWQALQTAHAAVPRRQGAAPTVFKTSATWQTFINRGGDTVAALRAMLISCNPLARTFKYVLHHVVTLY